MLKRIPCVTVSIHRKYEHGSKAINLNLLAAQNHFPEREADLNTKKAELVDESRQRTGCPREESLRTTVPETDQVEREHV